MIFKETLFFKTPRHKLKVDCYYTISDISNISVDKKLFLEMCKKGCRNFNTKYCCPPFSPDFHSFVKSKKLLFLLLKLDLNQLLDYKPYHRLKVANAVIKSRAERIMRSLEPYSKTKFLSNGACRLCKPCKRKQKLPCKHPDKMRFSLEALGVDCNKLSQDLFNINLLWYKDKKAPDYTCVICALPLNTK